MKLVPPRHHAFPGNTVVRHHLTVVGHPVILFARPLQSSFRWHLKDHVTRICKTDNNMAADRTCKLKPLKMTFFPTLLLSCHLMVRFCRFANCQLSIYSHSRTYGWSKLTFSNGHVYWILFSGSDSESKGIFFSGYFGIMSRNVVLSNDLVHSLIFLLFFYPCFLRFIKAKTNKYACSVRLVQHA